MTPITFETKRLYCRPTQLQDASLVLKLTNTPDWISFIGDRNIRSKAQAKEYIKTKMLPQLEALGYGNYTIILKENDVKIGTVGLYNRDGLEGVDIGFGLLPDYYSKGYAYEASKELLTIAKNNFRLSNIQAITLPENKASIRLIERLGLIFKETVQLPDDPDTLLLYTTTLD